MCEWQFVSHVHDGNHKAELVSIQQDKIYHPFSNRDEPLDVGLFRCEFSSRTFSMASCVKSCFQARIWLEICQYKSEEKRRSEKKNWIQDYIRTLENSLFVWRGSLATTFMVKLYYDLTLRPTILLMANNKIELYLIIHCNNFFLYSVVLPTLFTNKEQQQILCCLVLVHW